MHLAVAASPRFDLGASSTDVTLGQSPPTPDTRRRTDPDTRHPTLGARTPTPLPRPDTSKFSLRAAAAAGGGRGESEEEGRRGEGRGEGGAPSPQLSAGIFD